MAALDFPDAPTVGQEYGSAGTVWRWDGARWASTAGVSGAKGLVGWADGPQTDIGGIGSAGTDITGMAVTWNAVIGRTYRTTAYANIGLGTNATTLYLVIANAAGTGLKQATEDVPAGQITSLTVTEVVTAVATGSLTRKVRVACGAGTTAYVGTFSRHGLIVVEDITYDAGSGGPNPTPTPWTQVTLTAPWTHQAGQPVSYRMNGDVVEWRGRCNSASAVNTAYFTIPVGVRPVIDMPFPHATVLSSIWGAGAVYFQTSGAVGTLITNHIAAAFNGISYSVTP